MSPYIVYIRNITIHILNHRSGHILSTADFILSLILNSSAKGNEIENKNSGALNGYQYLGTQQYGGCGTEIRHMPN